MVHMVTIKLSSMNFFLWHNQVIPLLQCKKLYGYVDGSILMSSTSIDRTTNDIWKQNDQLIMSLSFPFL